MAVVAVGELAEKRRYHPVCQPARLVGLVRVGQFGVDGDPKARNSVLSTVA